MTDKDCVANLLSWCSERGFWLDPRIEVVTGPSGVLVVARDASIPVDSILVRIPRESVLSVKSSPTSELIPSNPYGRGAQLSLALALSVELVCGVASPWFPYLQSLPRDILGIPLFWTGGAGAHADSGGPTEWLNGTEAWKMLFESAENHASLFNEIDAYYHQIAKPVYFKVVPHTTPSLRDFYHAYSLVSSRSFLVDAYHGLAMVPIADAFNHAQENHVHLESDFDVCPECGSLQRCVHDDSNEDKLGTFQRPHSTTAQIAPSTADDFYDMACIRPIPKNSEIFNTYGETLSNAELLVQYGFILDVNDNDRLLWTFTELAQFSDDYLQLGRRWDSVAFRQRLDAMISRPFEDTLISQSELVHIDRTHEFCLNGDASVSHGLWLYFVLLLHLRNDNNSINKNLDTAVTEEAMNRQLKLELDASSGLDIIDVMSEPQPPFPGDHPQQGPNLRSPYGIIPELARLLVALCRARLARTGKPGVGTSELGEILDRLPNDTSSNPTRMAISLAMTERSILNSCMAAWEGLLLPP